MASEAAVQANKPVTNVSDVPAAVVKEETDQGEDAEDDEDEVLETRGQWQKIAEQVSQRDVPGIDAAYLAVDIEEGTEVVWNEVSFSKSKAKRDKDKVIATLEQLTRLKHPNIVKFYEFWCDGEPATTHDRLVFITEYMTSGTLLQFLKKSKKNNKHISEKIWKRWCQQILSALCYLHKLGIIHGNLTLDTIFIQHNGLVKIGSISPQDINRHVKTSVDNIPGVVHYIAPESGVGKLSKETDMYAFGICALEMLALELLGNGDTRPKVHTDEITRAVDSLQNESCKAFVSKCLGEASKRPTAEQLLMSPILQEVYTLLLYAAQVWRAYANKTMESLPGSSDDSVHRHSYPSFSESDPDKVVAEAFGGKKSIKASETRQLDLEKYIEEHQVDILYQESISALKQQEKGNHLDQQPIQPCDDTQRPNYDPEIRTVIDGSCEVVSEAGRKQILIKLLFHDRLQRKIISDVKDNDTPAQLTESLVNCGLINQSDQLKVKGWIQEKSHLLTAAVA